MPRVAPSEVAPLTVGILAGSQERGAEVCRRMRTGQVDVDGGAFDPMAAVRRRRAVGRPAASRAAK